MDLNLEPLKTFFTEDTRPKVFAQLLDEFLYDYVTMIVRIQLSDWDDKTVHHHAEEFICSLRQLRDILPLCEK